MPNFKSNWNFAITVNCENADAAFISAVFWHCFELMFVLLLYSTLAVGNYSPHRHTYCVTTQAVWASGMPQEEQGRPTGTFKDKREEMLFRDYKTNIQITTTHQYWRQSFFPFSSHSHLTGLRLLCPKNPTGCMMELHPNSNNKKRSKPLSLGTSLTESFLSQVH